MAIAVAVQKGSVVYVYDEKNHQLFARSGELHGYTSGSVTIKIGHVLYTYNEKNSQISARNI